MVSRVLLCVLLLAALVCCQGTTDGGVSSTGQTGAGDGQVVDPVQAKVVACEKKLKDTLSVYEKDKEALKQKNSLLEGRVADLQREAKGLQSKLEREVKKASSLESDLRNERSSRTRSSQEKAERLDAAMKELEALKEAWLPVWLSKRLNGLETVGAKAKPLADGLMMVWRTRVVPVGKRAAIKGWKVCQQGLAHMHGKAADLWERTLPETYRITINSYIRVVKKALVRVKGVAYPLVMRYSRKIRAQLIIAVDELSRLVEVFASKYPNHLSWAAQGSRPVAIAVFILCFPFIAVGMPLLSSATHMGSSSPKQKPPGKRKKKKKV